MVPIIAPSEVIKPLRVILARSYETSTECLTLDALNYGIQPKSADPVNKINIVFCYLVYVSILVLLDKTCSKSHEKLTKNLQCPILI